MLFLCTEVIILAKKTSAKKAPKKKVSKKKKKAAPLKKLSVEITIFRKVPKNKEFFLADGRRIKSLKELAFAFRDMGDDVFWHHVNDARNDFVSWIEEVFEEKELAEELKEIRDKLNSEVAVLRHIVKKI